MATRKENNSKTTKKVGSTRSNKSISSNKSVKKPKMKKVIVGVAAAAIVAGGAAAAVINDNSFSRNDYFTGWDVAGMECDLRSQLLEETSLTKVKFGDNGCTVIYGEWQDPYTGEIISGNPGGGETSDDFDIDHIIPLGYVDAHGGREWSSEKKREYGASMVGKEKGLYLVVLASENRSKGDKGISEYYPPNEDFECDYTWLWHDIAKEYDISLDKADSDKIKEILSQPKCERNSE